MLPARRPARPPRGELAAAVVDLIDGGAELLVNGAAAAQLARTAAADAELTQIASATARTAGVGQGLSVLCAGLAMWGGVLVGISAVRADRLNGVLLAVIALIPLAAFELVTGLPGATQTLQRVRRSAARVLEVLDAAPVLAEPLHPVAVGAAPHTLCARGLRCRYPDREAWALDGIDLELGPGRRLAIVGPSGAGKSTAAAVLLRFLAYEGGSVTLDGVELAKLDGDEVRRVIGLVAQDAHIFDTTLAENLRFARRDATDEQLLAVLGRVRLLDWALALPAGIETEVGERGARLSGGQRQRLAVARALLADFPLLVLDEPGEHLDTLTADAILADLLDVTRGRSILLITHRLAGLQQIDEIIVLDGGRVLERGTHAELIRTGGRYAGMWAREQATETASV